MKAQEMLEVHEGIRLLYSDSRSKAECVVLSVNGPWFTVQFEDRADTTTFHASNRAWTDYLSVCPPTVSF